MSPVVAVGLLALGMGVGAWAFSRMDAAVSAAREKYAALLERGDS